eukprot:CAMPEP_0172357198 /NCGR_PEP_ID=MMETSP1060-20121228/1574_1 /TAXON_ID=37318 /ORGANISM="Pseudo-nitzschia pungens, Strain cf. cingulata" /LENGTH=726 /DNA_ID=CAMNT_0013077741 /DNA_START=99 /DNA_END=2279 /DNA_ORIENTATION=-
MPKMTTSWTRGPEEAPLYSDWRVSFTTNGIHSSKGDMYQDAASVSTSSTATSSSGDDSVATSDSMHENDTESSPNDQQEELVEVPKEEEEVEEGDAQGEGEEPKEEDAPEPEEGKEQPAEKEQAERHAYFSIHRNMIGPKSEFFTKSFLERPSPQKDNINSSASNVISLPSDLSARAFASVVEAFEIILEYCYCGANFDVLGALSTSNAVAAFCLCKYFGMHHGVCDMVQTFIEADLTPDTVTQYYQVVKDLRSEEPPLDDETATIPPAVLDVSPIMGMVVSLCHKNPSVLGPACSLSKITDLPLWLEIGSLLARDHDDSGAKGSSEESSEYSSEETEDQGNVSKVWSQNITYFFDNRLNHESVDIKYSFCQLTAESVLPEVSETVALRLLEYELKYGLDKPFGGDGIAASTSTATESTNYESSIEEDEEPQAAEADYPLSTQADPQSSLTSLQQRCIKALTESNWSGPENELKGKAGTLTQVTTPAVLELLLIESVTCERGLGAKIKHLEATVDAERKLRADQEERQEFFAKEKDFAIAKEIGKQMSLQKIIDREIEKREAVEAQLEATEARMETEKQALCQANANLEAKLEAEQKRSYSLKLRMQALENARSKTESDREMYELTVRETIKRLENIVNPDEWWASCGGLATVMMLMSTENDHMECARIKAMLQNVIRDPISYERDYLLQLDDLTAVSTSKDESTFVSMSNTDDEDDDGTVGTDRN